jgi:hypothetical protein
MSTTDRPLIYLKATTAYAVPPVYTGYWTAADWARTGRTVCEPLVLDALGDVWVATGERDERGQLLYRNDGPG